MGGSRQGPKTASDAMRSRLSVVPLVNSTIPIEFGPSSMRPC